MIVDGAAAVQAHDKSGEVLHIDGIDTSSVDKNHCGLTWEHITDKRKDDRGEMVPNEGHTALDVVGRVTYAHKILSQADCENDRQRMYWQKIQFPFLYIVGRLFDGAGHPAAMALAAILRDGVANDEPPLCEYSIEGHTLERDGNELLQTVMRRVTFTQKPCNSLATSGVLEDPNAPRGYDEHPGSKDDADDALVAIRDIRKGESLDVRIGGYALQIDPVVGRLRKSNDVAEGVAADEAAEAQRYAQRPGSRVTILEHPPGGLIDGKPDVPRPGLLVRVHAEQRPGDIDREYAEVQDETTGETRRFHRLINRGLVSGDGGPPPHPAKPTNDWQEIQTPCNAIAKKSRLPACTGHSCPRCHGVGWDWFGTGSKLKFEPYQAKDTDQGAGPGYPVLKTYDAGMGMGAPHTLTGGAALQREEISGSTSGRSKKLAALAAATAKHYDADKHGPLRKYLATALAKMQMPEISDEFLDHYADLVENHLRLSRRALRKDEPAPDVQPPKAPKKVKSALTFRGQPVKPNPDLRNGKFEFDEDQGVLRTQHGTFHLYNPDHDPHHAHAGEAFRASLASPEVAKIHDYAMQQWLRLHEALKAGTLPQAVLGTAVAFSQLSPNTPVHVHELMSSALYDTVHQNQTEIHDPAFAGLKNNFLRRSHPTKLPEHSRDYFQTTLKDALALSNASKKSGRKVGQLPSFMLGSNKFDNIAQYAGVHDQFVQTVRRHGVDARAAVGDLMNAKIAKARWDAHRQRRLARGQTDPGPYEGAPRIHGLAQKTARFAYAMLGAGNSLVPDTHMIRHLFGLDKSLDGRTIEFLKQRVIWQPKNTALLNAIDRWYFRNHPAVQHMLDHPEFGKHFRADPQQAVFGSFWRHWLAISSHEAQLGHADANLAFNTLATHRPYFEEAQRHFADPNAKPVGKPTPFARVQKAESVPGGPLIDPADAAELLHDWTQQLGHAGAMIRYYAHLVPLLYPDESLHPGVNLSSLEKSLPIEAAMVEIRKAQIDLRRALGEPLAKADGDVTQAGRKKIPAPVPQQPGGGAVKKPASAAPPRPKWDGKVDAAVHGSAVHNTTPEQHDLIHGINLHRPVAGPKHESMAAVTEPSWHKSPKAGLVITKDSSSTDPNAQVGDIAHHEVTYHNAMRDVLGLGAFVPTTASFYHPETGMHTSVQQAVPRAEHADVTRRNVPDPYTTERMSSNPSPVNPSSLPASWLKTPHHADSEPEETTNPMAGKPTLPERELAPHQAAWIKQHADSGDLDKLAMANKILGNYDRHFGNFLFSQQAPHVRLIDHSHTFHYGGWDDSHPAYYRAAGYADPKFANSPVHPAAAAWVAGLNPEKLRQHLLAQGHDEATANHAAHRVRHFQKAVQRGYSRNDLMTGTGYSRPPSILPRPEFAT